MEDVVWRADTGQYHPRTSGVPVLLPPMRGGSSAGTSAAPEVENFWRWLASPDATNLLLLLILLCLILRRR
ncbi:MAG: hypothetical protein WDA16_05920 [Candidatus Thermoplasmatota archaeon]